MHINDSILLNAIPAVIVLIVVETVYLTKEHQQDNKDLLTNLTAGIVAVPVNLLMKGLIFYTYSFVYQCRLFNLAESAWHVWVICILADDFTFYWHHRFSHKIRFLWASHVVHHSSEKFTFSAAVRSSWTNNLTGVFLFWCWIPLLGVEPSMLIFVKTASIAYQFWLHTETIHKMPKWFEAVFNTPSHHRVHHASDIQYLDKNHAGMFIIWDKLFGTFQEETSKPTYGLTQNIHTYNPVTIEFYGWVQLIKDLKKSKSLKESLHYIFGVPGWSSDGSSKTTHQLQGELIHGEASLLAHVKNVSSHTTKIKTTFT